MKSHSGCQEDSDPTPQYHMVGIRTERKFQKPETMVERRRSRNNIILFCLELDLFDLFLNKIETARVEGNRRWGAGRGGTSFFIRKGVGSR